MSFIPKPHEIYKHFKGNLYQITTIAEHTETGETLVVYQAMYGDFKTFALPLAMFVSPVDREKYPDAAQEFQFELQGPEAERQKAELQRVSGESGVLASGASVPPVQAAREATEVPVQAAREATEVPAQAAREATEVPAQAAREATEVPVQAAREAIELSAQGNREAMGLTSQGNREESKPSCQGHTEPGYLSQEPAGEPEELNIDPLVLEFLDADSYEQRLNILAGLHHRITDDMITTMAIACDLEIVEGDIEERYESLKTCLLTMERYECNRLRRRI